MNSINNSISKKISVIIPVYNAKKYIKQCLYSVINQNYRNLEIIIVNDGSTDNSLKIINKFASKDNRIKVYNQKNQGGNIALNNGIKYATGDYMHFLDADDFLPENIYQNLINKSAYYNVDLCLLNYIAIDNKNNILYKKPLKITQNEYVTSLKEDPEMLLFYSSAQWIMFLKTSIIKDNNLFFDNTKFGYDVLMHINVLKYSKKILILKDCLVNYRLGNPNSSSGNITRSIDYPVHFECFKHCVDAYKNEAKIIRDINICLQYNICFFYLNTSIPKYKVKNYFLLNNFSKSFSQKIINSLKQNKNVYEKYLSIVNGSYLNNLQKKNKDMVSSKSNKTRKLTIKLRSILKSIKN